MKTPTTVAILSIVFLGISHLFGQQPLFAPLGAVWYYNEYNCGTPGPVTYTVAVYEDSIINGKYCTKLPNSYCHSDASCMDYVYVHQDGSKVFVYEPLFNEFQMLYDFSLQAGDSYPYIMCMGTWGVDSVTIHVDFADTVFQQLRVVPIHPTWWWDDMNVVIAKGVGGVNTINRLLFYDACISVDCPLYAFLCYQTPNGVNYPPGCVSAAEEGSLPKDRLLLYPNPASDFLHIDSGSSISARAKFRILNTEGKMVKDFMLAPSQANYILSIRDLTPGMYYLQYFEHSEVKSVERFMVQK